MSRMTRRVELFPDAEEGFRQVGSPLLENAEYGEEKRDSLPVLSPGGAVCPVTRGTIRPLREAEWSLPVRCSYPRGRAGRDFFLRLRRPLHGGEHQAAGRRSQCRSLQRSG